MTMKRFKKNQGVRERIKRERKETEEEGVSSEEDKLKYKKRKMDNIVKKYNNPITLLADQMEKSLVVSDSMMMGESVKGSELVQNVPECLDGEPKLADLGPQMTEGLYRKLEITEEALGVEPQNVESLVGLECELNDLHLTKKSCKK